MKNEPIIEIKNLSTSFGTSTIFQNVNLSIYRGEIFGIVGGSGSGKTTLLRTMLGLLKPTQGTIKIFGQLLDQASPTQLLNIQRRWGVLFQQNALFSSINLLKNVAFPLKEHTDLAPEIINQLALIKIAMTGLPLESAYKFPAELSGGMQKRAGLARAMVMDPELIFLDEPTAGLDPKTAAGFDELILNLRKMLNLTIVMVTHDLDSLWRTTDRVAFLGEGKVLAVKPLPELVKIEHPLIQDFFAGERGQRNDN